MLFVSALTENTSPLVHGMEQFWYIPSISSVLTCLSSSRSGKSTRSMSGMPSKDILVLSSLLTSRRMADCSYPPRMTTLSGYGTCMTGPQSFWRRRTLHSSMIHVILPQFLAPMGGMWPHRIVTGWWGYGMYIQASWREGWKCTRIGLVMLHLCRMGRVWWVGFGVGIINWDFGMLALWILLGLVQDHKRQLPHIKVPQESKNRPGGLSGNLKDMRSAGYYGFHVF